MARPLSPQELKLAICYVAALIRHGHIRLEQEKRSVEFQFYSNPKIEYNKSSNADRANALGLPLSSSGY